MKDIIIIDDFYANPEAVRSYALTRADYIPSSDLPAAFPGTESKKSFISPAIVGKMQAALGEEIVVNPEKFSFGVFAKALEGDDRKKVVHVDETGWTGLVYLNSKNCQGGTSFYRHRASGLDRIPDAAGLRAQGYASRDDFVNSFLRPLGPMEGEWEVSARVGMKFNRMVLFRAGELFHAAEGYFGSSDQDARLIQLFFFETKPMQALAKRTAEAV